ncbi:MAG: hypothetical protein IKA64_04665 [Clostridia bacterium]|nr:hypothetical protein [Clostridia bacterium]
MKNKSFSLTLSTILTLLLCLVAAIVLWLYVYYSEETSVTALFSRLPLMRTLL